MTAWLTTRFRFAHDTSTLLTRGARVTHVLIRRSNPEGLEKCTCHQGELAFFPFKILPSRPPPSLGECGFLVVGKVSWPSLARVAEHDEMSQVPEA